MSNTFDIICYFSRISMEIAPHDKVKGSEMTFLILILSLQCVGCSQTILSLSFKIQLGPCVLYEVWPCG